MATKKTVGIGTVLKVSTSTTAATSTGATAVGKVVNAGDYAGPVPKIDTTVIDDDEETCEPGIPSAGETTVTLAYRQGDTGVLKLLKMRKQRTKGKYWFCFASTELSDEVIKGYVSNAGRGTIARDQMIQRSDAARGDDRHLHGVGDGPRQRDVEAALRAVAIHRS